MSNTLKSFDIFEDGKKISETVGPITLGHMVTTKVKQLGQSSSLTHSEQSYVTACSNDIVFGMHKYELRDGDMELCWAPTFRFFVMEFDRLVAETNKKGFNIVTTEKREIPPLTVSEQGQSVTGIIRSANLGKVTLRLTMEPGCVYLGGSMKQSSSELSVLGGNPPEEIIMRLALDFNQANFSKHPAIPKPKDGIPPEIVTDLLTQSVAKGIERLLVMAAASGDK